MSEQPMPLTYEGVLELFRETREQFRETDLRIDRMFRETDRKFQETAEQFRETDRKFQETAEQIRQTNKDVGGLSSSVGAIVANMVKGHIVEKFEALGYHELNDYCENKKFKNKKMGINGEIDIFLENGSIAILIEVKTTLEVKDVREHIERLEKFRRCIDAKGEDKRQFIGAVAGGVVSGDAVDFALKNGLYVIVQSGEAVEILSPPDGFTAKRW